MSLLSGVNPPEDPRDPLSNSLYDDGDGRELT